ncbi:MAG TPA: formate dehydrogenase accessory sulfurtransferase FdhD [Gemmatimonadaceae bacterium]|nr:formate dehydrogenase accessory sulfurtransferase FdhD [Gemmatimonadaceae bacterium]
MIEADVKADVKKEPEEFGRLGYASPTAASSFSRLDEATTEEKSARLAVEVPVALVYNGRPHVVMMCTPADLEDFAYGFTLTEGIAQAADVKRVDVVKYSRGIELQIEIPNAAAERLVERGRALVGRTGCGLCGVEAIADALREPPLVQSSLTLSRDALWRASETLGSRQPMNNDTNAIHAAAWASSDGTLRVVREDVGRHNALDKVLGSLARGATSAGDGFLIVTSRASYELVQKAAVAGVPLLAAVSRPTALAVQLADDAGIALVGLLRGRTANVYTHRERIVN